jgi:hypothetical protein
MIRPTFASLALVTALVVSTSAQTDAKKYGAPLTLKETTKLSEILAHPDQYKDKRVQIEGPIIDVCAEMGCWLAIGGDKASDTIRFKVDDGVIVFPTSAKGLMAKVEGVIQVSTLTEAEQVSQGLEMAKDMKMAFDPKTVKGPKVSVLIKGEGAEVR